VPARPVTIYSTPGCPYAARARDLLRQRGIRFRDVSADDAARRAEVIDRTGQFTFPQIFIGRDFVGGYDELRALDRADQLGPRIAHAQLAG
jgi:glutaredoxin 3